MGIRVEGSGEDDAALLPHHAKLTPLDGVDDTLREMPLPLPLKAHHARVPTQLRLLVGGPSNDHPAVLRGPRVHSRDTIPQRMGTAFDLNIPAQHEHATPHIDQNPFLFSRHANVILLQATLVDAEHGAVSIDASDGEGAPRAPREPLGHAVHMACGDYELVTDAPVAHRRHVAVNRSVDEGSRAHPESSRPGSVITVQRTFHHSLLPVDVQLSIDVNPLAAPDHKAPTLDLLMLRAKVRFLGTIYAMHVGVSMDANSNPSTLVRMRVVTKEETAPLDVNVKSVQRNPDRVVPPNLQASSDLEVVEDVCGDV
mmetsp:Transcript_18719/g.38308  ORF Transcript_18719/g.38308 Transcript_18719/m.38308 type:complete len:312 (+) Transcript_18719:6206-7141(+)